MIIEKNTFYLKFGKAKEAIAIWKKILEESKKSNLKSPEMRLLSDISGSAYTLVLEMHIGSMIDINSKHVVWATHPTFQELYQQFIPLCDRAERAYYKIEAIV
jgi:hypothetical protein